MQIRPRALLPRQSLPIRRAAAHGPACVALRLHAPTSSMCVYMRRHRRHTLNHPLWCSPLAQQSGTQGRRLPGASLLLTPAPRGNPVAPSFRAILRGSRLPKPDDRISLVAAEHLLGGTHASPKDGHAPAYLVTCRRKVGWAVKAHTCTR